jgi:hypothetical protein
MSNYLRERIRQESKRQAGTEKDNSELLALSYRFTQMDRCAARLQCDFIRWFMIKAQGDNEQP